MVKLGYLLLKAARPRQALKNLSLFTGLILLFSYPFLSHDFFNYLFEHKVIMNTVILKVNMAVPGKESQIETPDVVAVKTLEMLHAGASVGLAGIVFLSGGQDAIEATKNLNAIVKKHDGNPWELTFSFERALTEPSMEIWKGKEENVDAAQKEFLKRAKLNSLASFGKYDEGMENE